MDIKHIMIDVVTWAGRTFWLAGLDGPLPIGDIIYVGGIGSCVVIDVVGGVMYLAKKAKSSNKEKATDIPSWAKGKKPRAGESGKEFAKRVMDERYGKDNYSYAIVQTETRFKDLFGTAELNEARKNYRSKME